MSPSRSKSKATNKPTSTANTSGYNPLLGTFHTLETPPVSSAQPVHVNSRFHEIDDSDTGFEYDCVSNNDSWSGESEDPKEKPSHGPVSRQETGQSVDNDKREKTRQKNEKKHQRQKERRAQELHERCCGYLMSKKLESLAQQLVAMGFPSERATMALIMNEGKLEESVAWLFESGEEDSGNQKRPNLGDNNGGKLKVDISQELRQIADMEVKFKCSKQEVERAVAACEGDLQMAVENLVKIQKPEENNVQLKSPLSSGAISIQQKPEDKDVIYPKMSVMPGGKSIELLKKVQPNSDWAKPQQVGPPLSKTETQTQLTSVGIEFRNIQIGSVEPVVMMQRAQLKNIPTVSSSSSLSHVGSNGVNPNGLTHTRSFNNGPIYGSSNHVFHYQQPPRQHVATNHLNNRENLGSATSLGLFSGGSPSHGWNGGWLSQFDYTSVDWSLNAGASGALRPNGLWMGSGSGKNVVGPSVGGGGGGWNSPFEEKDLFGLHVSSPSL